MKPVRWLATVLALALPGISCTFSPDLGLYCPCQTDSDCISGCTCLDSRICVPAVDGGICSLCACGVCQSETIAVPHGAATAFTNGVLALGPARVFVGYTGVPTGGVARMGKDGTGASCILCDVGEPRDVATAGAFVYWTDTGLGELRRAPVGGGKFKTLWSGNIGSPLAIDQTSVYWYDSGDQKVMKADLAGTNATMVAPSQSVVISLAADGGFLFWTNGAGILAVDLVKMTPATVLVSGRTDSRSVAADATHVYWAEGQQGANNNAVMRVARGTGAVEQVAAGEVFAIALDAKDVYAADNHGGTIWRAPKTGGKPVTIATGHPFPFDIAVDESAVYWTSETTAQLFKVAK